MSLSDHKDNLLPTLITPRTVSGHRMYPIGKYQSKKYRDDLHMHPEVNGTLLLWKACKALNILPFCYPQPLDAVSTQAVTTQPTSKLTQQVISDDLMAEFPFVFDNQIKAMNGEHFHIALIAYKDKLKPELEALQ